MVYGIPEFRLPKAIVQREIDTLQEMGVEIKTNFVVGRTRKLKDLLEQDGYDAVFIGTGAGLPTFMGIEGENLVGVFSANEYLTRSNLMKAYAKGKAFTPIFNSKKVVVLGGGNVAMDLRPHGLAAGRRGGPHRLPPHRGSRCPPARRRSSTPRRRGCSSTCSRTPSASWATRRAGVVGMECVRYELGEPDSSGRRPPGGDPQQRVRDGRRHRDRGDRQLLEPVDQADHGGAGDHQIRQHRHRREPEDLHGPASTPVATSSWAPPR